MVGAGAGQRTRSLGDVRGDRVIVGSVAVGAKGPRVELGAPAEFDFPHGRAVRGADQDPASGGAYGIDEHIRRELRKRRILPVISRKGAPNIKGLGKLRYVIEQTFALLHQFKRLAVRWDRRTELHDAFVSLASSLICWRRLKKARSWS